VGSLSVAERLVLIAHGATAGTREMVFGDRSALLEPGAGGTLTDRVASWCSGPEPACIETARRLGADPDVLQELVGLDAGRWAGQRLMEVGAVDADGLRGWLSDPTSTPHGGESLARLIQRVGAFCDQRDWAQGRNVVVVAPLVARAMAVHALRSPAEVIFRIDLAPLGRVGLTRHGAGWRLQQLG
jgi:broad specificity phosphatase PhoE